MVQISLSSPKKSSSQPGNSGSNFPEMLVSFYHVLDTWPLAKSINTCRNDPGTTVRDYPEKNSNAKPDLEFMDHSQKEDERHER